MGLPPSPEMETAQVGTNTQSEMDVTERHIFLKDKAARPNGLTSFYLKGNFEVLRSRLTKFLRWCA